MYDSIPVQQVCCFILSTGSPLAVSSDDLDFEAREKPLCLLELLYICCVPHKYGAPQLPHESPIERMVVCRHTGCQPPHEIPDVQPDLQI